MIDMESGKISGRENDLIVRKKILDEKISHLRYEYSQAKNKKDKLAKQAIETFGTDNPEKLIELAEKEESEYLSWLKEFEQTLSANERLVANVKKDLDALRGE